MIVTLLEDKVVVMEMPVMAEADARHELVRFWYLAHRFEIAAAIDEGEGLSSTVGALGRHCHILCSPGRAPFAANTPARGCAILEDLNGDGPVAGVDAPNVSAVRVSVILSMSVSRGRSLRAPLILPGSPQHPERDGDNDAG
ncbi:MAG TPA: hypothetical protein VJS66_07065 [Burkholderiales bacterium]|nr:hypothetical protein [Burkholderiales bacterium]